MVLLEQYNMVGNLMEKQMEKYEILKNLAKKSY